MFDDVNYFDISPTLSEKTAVFPGDTTFKRKVLLDFKKGHNLVLSEVELSVHTGAHTDAPNHYHPEGVGMDQRELRYYMGTCQVISVKIPMGDRIRPEHIQASPVKARRVLFKTGSYPDPNFWNGDFNSLSEELIEFLVERNVILVGIDTPSIDPAEDKVLESHNAVYKNNLAILEGIVLDQVPDGIYTLLALPLKIEGADASPVRAILIKES